MQDLLKFNIELMQNDPALSWLFEQKECWNALLTQNLRALLEGNRADKNERGDGTFK